MAAVYRIQAEAQALFKDGQGDEATALLVENYYPTINTGEEWFGDMSRKLWVNAAAWMAAQSRIRPITRKETGFLRWMRIAVGYQIRKATKDKKPH